MYNIIDRSGKLICNVFEVCGMTTPDIKIDDIITIGTENFKVVCKNIKIVLSASEEKKGEVTNINIVVSRTN